jgi:hypothetical protein
VYAIDVHAPDESVVAHACTSPDAQPSGAVSHFVLPPEDEVHATKNATKSPK